MRERAWTVLALCLLLASCANLHSIYRKKNLDDKSTAIAVDAKQRFLISREDTDLRKVCMEPSPDVFSVLSASLGASAEYKDVSASLRMQLAESAATIGLRTETIQLLRDAMYRICELAWNDDMSGETAALLHERYQKSMVTLAAVAALADAARPVQVGIGSRTSMTPGTVLAELASRLAAQRIEVAEYLAALDTAKNDLQSAGDAVCNLPLEGNGGTVCSGASTEKERAERRTAFCSSTAAGDECKTLAAAEEARRQAEALAQESSDALKQLEVEYNKLKENPNMETITEVVALGDPRPRTNPANLQPVATVVNELVKQVYASGHLEACLDIVQRLGSTSAKEAELTAQSNRIKAAISILDLQKGNRQSEGSNQGDGGGGVSSEGHDSEQRLSILGTLLDDEKLASSLARTGDPLQALQDLQEVTEANLKAVAADKEILKMLLDMCKDLSGAFAVKQAAITRDAENGVE